MPAATPVAANTQKQSALEDLQGLSFGVFTCSLGVVFLSQLGFLTGQSAGLALLLSYVLDMNFGLIFFLVNLPFYWFTYKKLGLEFTIKSALCVTAMAVTVDLLRDIIVFEALNPLVGTLAFGALAGVGILACIRHKSSLGGMTALALTIQDATGFKAGYVQQIADVLIFTAALFLFPFEIVLWSIFGSLILNFFIAVNHRRDRYIVH
ncbi:YitT family protein [Roseibium denhamense]|uniref:YitT family protein n=1 Tax=Roseibium denhamense TaxID=76305 RepID=UPI0012BB6CBF|nr:YitT family protein [Roseibium denhamense]MTI06030.1 YitT family protein [Roseibium denhamense]